MNWSSIYRPTRKRRLRRAAIIARPKRAPVRERRGVALIMVMVIAIFVYTVTPINGLIELWGVPDGAPKLALVILVRILLMPVIAGISYEITVKWAGSNPDNPLVKVVLWPGMQMQYLTTNEPDDGQIECAIAAMQKVLEREEAEEAGEKAAAGAPDNADEPATATA